MTGHFLVHDYISNYYISCTIRLVVFQHICLLFSQRLFSEQLKVKTYDQKITPCFVIDFVVELFYVAYLYG